MVLVIGPSRFWLKDAGSYYEEQRKERGKHARELQRHLDAAPVERRRQAQRLPDLGERLDVREQPLQS